MKNKYKTLIITSWVVLGICLIIKLFGGNWFEFVYTNKHFINFCNVFNYGIPYYLLCTIIYTITINIYYMAVLKLKRPSLVLIGIAILTNVIKIFLINFPIISFIFEILVIYFVPIVLKFSKKMFLRSFLSLIMFIGFQLISLIIRNLGIHIIENNLFIGLLYGIDYTIMVVLYYLYSIKEEV